MIELNKTADEGLSPLSDPTTLDVKETDVQHVSTRSTADARPNPYLRASAIDENLPEWARRSNPIVRRHLGTAWKTFTPNPRLLLRLYGLQVIIIAISIAAPFVFALLMPTVTVSLVLIPIGAVMYAQILVQTGSMSATYMVDERRNETLSLTLVIPQPTRNIIFSKIAAALWRHVENLMLMSLAVVLFSLPLMIIQYDIQFSIMESPGLVRIGLALGLAVSLLRLWIEPIMFGALGAVYGAASRSRVQAITATLLTGGAYFAFVNLARLLPVDGAWRLVIETALPIVLPLLIIFVSLRATQRLLTQD